MPPARQSALCTDGLRSTRTDRGACYKDALPCGYENLKVMILEQKGMTVETDKFQEMRPGL
jgi:hypothetical protein